MENVGIILLAAGMSARLGKPKQLLQYHGESLLQKQLKLTIETGVDPIIVVLGANADLLSKEIVHNQIEVVINPDYKEGMSTSIRCGLDALMKKAPATDCIILMVCDQPFVTAILLRNLIATHINTGKPIVTCGYQNTFGPPTLFHKTMFSELLKLNGDIGARKVIQQHFDKTEIVLFPLGSVDIDTEEDYQKLLARDETGELYP